MCSKHGSAWLLAAAIALWVNVGRAAIGLIPADEPAAKLSLESSAWPAGVSTPAQYETFLETRLNQLRRQVDQQVTSQAKARAWLALASFALTHATEPALSEVWLGISSDGRRIESQTGIADGWSRAPAITSLKAAQEALSQAARAVKDKALSRQDVESLECDARRLGTLARMEASILEQASADEALAAAREADAMGECLPEAGENGWHLLIAACLARAGRPQDAQLRLQGLLRSPKGTPAHLAAQTLSIRLLTKGENYAAAVALLGEYLQAARPKNQATSPEESGDTGKTSATQPGQQTRTDERIARCTLLLVKSNVLACWAAHLSSAGEEPYAQETAASLQKESAECLRQAIHEGPAVARLQPLLLGLGESAGP